MYFKGVNRISLKIIAVFSLLLSISSCISERKIMNKPTVPVREFSQTEFNGTYSNKHDRHKDKSYSPTLWEILEKSYSFRKRVKVSKDALIELYFDGGNLLKISAYENNSSVAEIKLKVKIRNNYVVAKRKWLFIPIPALMYKYEEKVILGIINVNKIVVKRGYERNAWILLFAAGFSQIDKYFFDKKN